jgi:transcription antitermination factor NusG
MHQWYILQVYSGNEKKIERELLAQLEKKRFKKKYRTDSNSI